MRTIVHISDLHFGRIHSDAVSPLIEAIVRVKPDVVAVSGDLTQRARVEQFKEARAFLDQIVLPKIVVPGNHDIPLYNAVRRFVQPLSRYRRHITDDLSPAYIDGEVALVGINTARSLTGKAGRINLRQITHAFDRFRSVGDNLTKIVVTHHPFDVPETLPTSHLVGRAQMAVEKFAGCGVDLFLAGHLHVAHTGSTALRYKIHGHSALIIQAGTAISTRGRGELNSFNVLRIARPEIRLERFEWESKGGFFVSSGCQVFRHSDKGWSRASGMDCRSE